MLMSVLKDAFGAWKVDDCPRMSAAMAYYTVFALPPLLMLVLMVTGVFVDPEQVSTRIQSEIGGMVGPEGARQIQSMIRNVDRPGTGGPLAAVLSTLALLFGATGAFRQLQAALDRAWEVEADPSRSSWIAQLSSRLLSLGLVLTIALLLLISLVVSALITAFGETITGWLPVPVSGALLQGVDLLVSLAVATALFATLFKILPHAKIAWRDVGFGAFGTALLFVLGKFLLGYYFSRSDPGEAFGAAGSLAVVMAWVYYSALIVFYGAEFTQAWAARAGRPIEPSEGAVRVTVVKRRIENA